MICGTGHCVNTHYYCYQEVGQKCDNLTSDSARSRGWQETLAESNNAPAHPGVLLAQVVGPQAPEIVRREI